MTTNQAPWTVETATVIGVLSPPRLSAEFASGRLVFGIGAPLAHLLIHRGTEQGQLKGDPLSVDEWEALLASEEALALSSPVHITRPAVGWVFRDASRRPWWKESVAELAALGALEHQERLPEPERGVICVVHVGSAGTVRDKWASTAHDRAWQILRDGAGPRGAKLALRLAKRADCLARRLEERHTAMLAVAYSLAGQKTDSEGVLAMARNSRGEEFVGTVNELRSRLLDELDKVDRVPKAPRHPRRSRAAEEFRTYQNQALEDYLHGRP